MKIKEFYEVLINTDTSSISVEYDDNFSDLVRDVKAENGYLILSSGTGTYDKVPYNTKQLSEKIENWFDEDLEVVYRVPSKGIYKVNEIQEARRDYPEENEHYDEILVICEKEPFAITENELDKLTEGYAVQNIDEKNQKVIESLRTGLKSSIEKCLKEIDSLKSSISLYQEAIADYVDLSIEKSDIVAKYSKASNGGTYNLPGVFASSVGSYDINAMRADNQRIEQVKSLYEVAEGQKDAYFKMIVRAQNEMKIYLTSIARINNDLDIYLEQLAQENSWEANKNIKK